jgi:hypothetical protein
VTKNPKRERQIKRVSRGELSRAVSRAVSRAKKISQEGDHLWALMRACLRSLSRAAQGLEHTRVDSSLRLLR